MTTQVTTSPTRLHGYWLFLARAAWVAIAILALLLTTLGIPRRFDHLRHLSPTLEDALRQLDLSADFYAGYILTVGLVFILGYFMVAGVIFWRRSDDGLALLVSAMLITFAVGESSITDGLLQSQPRWHWPIEVIQAFGMGSSLVLFFIFPDGTFVPRWTRSLTFIWVVLTLIWLLFPSTPFNPLYSHVWLQNPLPSFLVILAWFGTGAFAQVYRYLYAATPIQRQQTKWIVFGFTAAYLAGIARFLPPALLPSFRQPGQLNLLSELVTITLAAPLALCFPLSIGFSIFRYRLWDIDLIIRRTMIYGFLTALLTLVYLGSVALFQVSFRSLLGSRTEPAIVASTLLIAALFYPLRRRIQTLIDRRFYREKVDFQQAFTEFSHEVRLVIALPELLQLLVVRITDLLHSTHGAIYLRSTDGVFPLAKSMNLPAEAVKSLPLDHASLSRLQAGLAVAQSKDVTFSLILPLTAPQPHELDLVGLLALGPRRSGQPYSRQDQSLLSSLAHQAGTAIAVAKLVTQSIEFERQLETHRTSPIGRAEAWVRDLLAHSDTAPKQLHRLAQAAGHDLQVASLLANAAQALDNVTQQRDMTVVEDDIRAIKALANGYHDLLRSQVTPELLTIGLRTLTIQLEQPPANLWQESAAALFVFRQCQAALTLDSIAQIEALVIVRSSEQPVAGTVFEPLARTLAQLCPVVDAVRAYERITLAEDKLSYLVRAVEALGQLKPPADVLQRVIFQGITVRWTALFTAALRALSSEAQLNTTLITRQIVAAEHVTLAFELTNSGRGTATNIKLELMPDDGFDIIDGKTSLDRLQAGQSMQVVFVIHPLTHEVLRPSLRIDYDDQDRTEKSLLVTASVHSLHIPATFRPIPNLYSPGIPLRTNSPIFFGREDLLAFVHDTVHHLAGGRVLVLTGERRMGKTSLAQQLPRHLQSDCVTVYLDCQSLAVDPGIESFFYDVALEIADAVNLPIPDITNFAMRPLAFFRREFLPRALDAAGTRQLLLLFDEYEELEARVANGKLSVELFSFLRHLMQHEARLGFIFVGTHRLAELNAGYWSAFFNVALHRQVSRLTEEATKTVITQPVTSYLFYEDLALDKMWRLTAGHPYFLQLLCHTVVSEANRAQRNYVLVEHLNAAVEQALELGEAHFVFLWQQLRPPEQKLLHLVATQTGRGISLTPAVAASYLALAEKEASDILSNLVEREILRPIGGPTPGYEFVLDVLRLWIQRRLH
jgi:hypothetical protein